MNIRTIKSTDFERVEQLIRDAILEINAKDYSQQVVDFMLQVDPFRPRDTNHERDYFVAYDEDILGVIGLKDNEVKTFFVDPRYTGKGIGSSLLSYIESVSSERGYEVSKVYSSVSAKSFYEKQGYAVISEDLSTAGEGTMLRYYMEKKLRKK
jgi:GNAT superfamily N-acetyltransferase